MISRSKRYGPRNRHIPYHYSYHYPTVWVPGFPYASVIANPVLTGVRNRARIYPKNLRNVELAKFFDTIEKLDYFSTSGPVPASSLLIQ